MRKRAALLRLSCAKTDLKLMNTLLEEPGSERSSIQDEMEAIASTSASVVGATSLTSAHSHPRHLAAFMLAGPSSTDASSLRRNGRRPSAPSFFQHLEAPSYSALTIRRPSVVATTAPPPQHNAVALRRPSAVVPSSPPKYPSDEERNLIEDFPIRQPEIKEDTREMPQQRPSGSYDMTLTVFLSAMYGKLLVFLGIAFPITETIAVDSYYYQGYYLFLYIGTFIFLGFMYGTVLRSRAVVFLVNAYRRNSEAATYRFEDKRKGHNHRYGSFYLRLGAIAFGIGSMVYSGLEFGQYFELRTSSQCRSVTRALTPAARMLLTLVQMQFIFLSNRSIDMGRHKTVAHFGLAHMVATNLCEWLYVIVEEAKHEIEHLPSGTHGDHGGHGGHEGHDSMHALPAAIVSTALPWLNMTAEEDPHLHHVHHRSAEASACNGGNIMGSLVRNAAPFLFPCTIEYSLICAVILFEMWKHAHEGEAKTLVKVHSARQHDDAKESVDSDGDFQRRSVNHLSVDCTKAHKGLFSGILIVVLTIIALILFFVLNEAEEYQPTSLLVVNICELTLYLLTTLAVLVASCQMRVLPYKDDSAAVGLDNALLVMAQTGMFMYCLFSIIGYHFTNSESRGLVAEVASLIQTMCQTVFVLDASRRRITNIRQWRLKPGRQWVTFLLVANMAMWSVNTLEKSRAEFRPTHLQFYGVWAWTIITHISMPLAIFYRFHSTICLFEIWKSCYKYKSRESMISNA